MGLDPIERAALNSTIDQMIDNIPDLISKFKPRDVKKYLGISNQKDFVMGFALGTIMSGFIESQSRDFSSHDTDEVERLTFERVNDVSYAISQSK
jgi:hypothetical protein